ncbi:MAG: DUF6703 family protein [Ornithinibacter sp.]
MSPLRESIERNSLPALTWLSRLPRAVPFLLVLGLAVAGILLPPPGWLLIAAVALLLAWILYLAWPRLTSSERLLRLAVVAMLLAITLTQAFPRT